MASGVSQLSDCASRSDDRLAWRMFDALLLALLSITSLMGILLVPVAALMDAPPPPL
jgi:hypothetical protein